MTTRLPFDSNVPLAPLTTLGVGGPARYYVEVENDEALLDVLEIAADAGLDLFILGGGSNLVVADAGFSGLVIRLVSRAMSFVELGDQVRVEVEGGAQWDDLVREAVDRNLAGLECLSGIPGTVGAAPVQNIGAYGQEVASRIEAVEAIDLRNRERRRVEREECGFGYRTSRFKREWKGKLAITRVILDLTPGGEPALTYDELRQRALAQIETGRPTLAGVRDLVLSIRRTKSMLQDPDDPNGRSAGSFFVNPTVDRDIADQVSERSRREGWGDPPRFPAAEAQGVKLSAAWLIERAGFPRGYSQGRVGLSTRHALAIVTRPGARATDVVELARAIRNAVLGRFGVRLTSEPELLGFDPRDVADLVSGSGAVRS